MSINLLGSFGSGVKLDSSTEKDARQKAEETAASAFANLLNKPISASPNSASNVAPPKDLTVVTGNRSNTVIPATLIDASASDPEGAASATAANTLNLPRNATEEFLEFAQKSPAEKMRALILSQLGLTEEALGALDADARAEIEAKIKTMIEAKIREEMEKKSGVAVNMATPEALSA